MASPEQLNFISLYWGKYGSRTLARMVGLERTTVQYHAAKMGLRSPSPSHSRANPKPKPKPTPAPTKSEGWSDGWHIAPPTKERLMAGR